jgi:hypothetical protein
MVQRTRRLFTRTTCTAAGVCVLLVAGSLSTAARAAAPPAGATFVDLGTAASYSVLAGTGITNTGTATVLAADLGLSPSGVISGFPPGTTQGTIHDKDAGAEQAQADRQTAYDAAAAETSTGPLTGDQAGVTFTPGVYTSAAAVTNTGTMTLDAQGDSAGIFVFQVGAAFSSAAASKIVLTNGALANNVFFQVAGAVAIGAGAKVVGTYIGAGAISFGEAATIKGRALAATTVTLADTPFAISKDDLTPPLLTIDGGAARSVNDTSPPISGTTDEAPGRPMSVTVAGQTLNTTVGTGGVWTVVPTPLTEGDHQVVATISDASQNTTVVDQDLTVDVTAPQVSIDGGPAIWTKDTTPTITGTTDEPAGASVRVTVGAQTLTTISAVGGHWGVTATQLNETAYSVVAKVDDAAGNTGTAIQVLTVDVTKPVVTIDGGSTRTTPDTSPWTYGSTGEQAGSTVVLTIGGQRLTTAVLSDGTWGVSAQTLPQGSYRVVASITDAAGNTGTATQTLVIGDDTAGPRYQPDAAIRHGKGAYVGARTYGGSAHQRLTTHLRPKAKKATFVVRLENGGEAADTFLLQGTKGSKKFRIIYTVGGKNVTRAVTAGTYRTHSLTAGHSEMVVMTITLAAAARPGDLRVFALKAVSSHASAKRDTVAAVARR